MYRPECKLTKAVLAVAAIAALAVTQASAAHINLTPAGGNGTVSSTSVTLADLIADTQGSLTVGDKVFTGFGYSFGGDMPASSQIQVLGLKDVAGNWGLRFQGPFLDLPGGPGNGASDAHISFAVEVAAAQAAQGIRITDAHLELFGVGAGEDSQFSVDEGFAGLTEILNAHYSTLGAATVANPDFVQSDNVIFATPQLKLNVVKDILALANANSTQAARTTVIDQSFSQIPEPTSMVLFGVAGLGMVAVARRRG